VVLFLWRNLGDVVDVTSRVGQEQALERSRFESCGSSYSTRRYNESASTSVLTHFGRPAFFLDLSAEDPTKAQADNMSYLRPGDNVVILEAQPRQTVEALKPV